MHSMDDETPAGRRPGPAAIRRALAECMTLADIDTAMGWTAGTAHRYRWRERGGLPPADAEIGRVPLWFRATFERWREQRPGRGAGGGRPRRDDVDAQRRTAAARAARARLHERLDAHIVDEP